MRLHNLKPSPGARRPRKRLGHGRSSGHGKTSGRGHKGQTSRSGGSIRPGFEGGQMPLIRRIPKRGFSNVNHGVTYVAINLADLDRFDDGAEVTEEGIRAAGLANGKGVPRYKILGTGTLEKKLRVSAHAFSATAKAKIEERGGECIVLGQAGAAKKV